MKRIPRLAQRSARQLAVGSVELAGVAQQQQWQLQRAAQKQEASW